MPEEVRIVTSRLRRFPRDSWTPKRALADGASTPRVRRLRWIQTTLIELVKASGLRGRGGAGFPTGVKWSFVPKDIFPKYIVVNHDEGEPGTFKDRELAEGDPFQLIEGDHHRSMGGASGRCVHLLPRRVRAWVATYGCGDRRVLRRGLLGKGILGSDFDLDMVLHRGAGAYICGEESALLDSLEGFRGQPRLRPPFPAVKGLYGQPTVINNTETLSSLPHIVAKGADWFKQWGTEKSPGTKMFSVSGHVEKPGNYEVPLGTSLRTSSTLQVG